MLYVVRQESKSGRIYERDCLSFWNLRRPAIGAANASLTLPFHKLTWTILSKLSVRRQVQSYLLNAPSFATDFLEILQDPEPYIGTWDEDPWTAERTLAMCMNLSLRRKARKIWSSQVSPDQVLKILTDLMEHNHSHINTYANSAMFYLLGDEQFRKS